MYFLSHKLLLIRKLKGICKKLIDKINNATIMCNLNQRECLNESLNQITKQSVEFNEDQIVFRNFSVGNQYTSSEE